MKEFFLNPFCFLISRILSQSSTILREKIWKNTKKIQKSPFFNNLNILKIIFFLQKNAILLVLLIKEISLRPELSSPPRSGFHEG